MADSLALDIRERIIAYLAGELALPELQDWLVGATWDAERRNDPLALDMAYEIKLALAEHDRGDITLAEFRERLSDLVTTTTSVVSVGIGESPVLTMDTTSRPVTVVLELQTVHTQFATVSW
jgi:hypothetical protein